jgi:hypothetical protein
MGRLDVFRTISNIVARLKVGPGRGGQPTDRWQDKRPRGAARSGDGRGIDLAGVLVPAPRCAPAFRSPRTRQFRNPFNGNRTSRDVGP